MKMMLKNEAKCVPECGYLSSQVQITEKMRSVSLEWVSEVAIKFKLLPETFFLTINYIDRYLS